MRHKFNNTNLVYSDMFLKNGTYIIKVAKTSKNATWIVKELKTREIEICMRQVLKIKMKRFKYLFLKKRIKKVEALKISDYEAEAL